MSKNIEIHIDRIVLHDFAYRNKAELNAAIQEQLLSMISQHGLPDFSNKGYHRNLNGGVINLPKQLKTSQVGYQVARGIYNGITSIDQKTKNKS